MSGDDTSAGAAPDSASADDADTADAAVAAAADDDDKQRHKALSMRITALERSFHEDGEGEDDAEADECSGLEGCGVNR